ncbi:MAG: YncE family protein [Ktedonobacteraceae bacterium]
MQKRTLWLSILISTLLTLILTACGSISPATTQPGSSATSTEESLYVVDGSLSSANVYTGQRIVEFHPGSTAQPVVLPAGLYSMDHKNIYTATPQNGQTTITVTNAQTGVTARMFSIPGNYTTSGEAYTTAVLSADGRWLALRQQDGTNTQSTIVLVDTQAGKLAKTIQLPGDYDLDAISPDGNKLYVLEEIDQAGHYHVRLFEVSENQLVQGYITDKVAPRENMYGAALSRQMASDGTIAYTLYTNPEQNKAFVHILPLASNIYIARCIDLPVGKSPDLLRYYTLALSADGTTLYAANGALGVVTSISLNGDQVFDDNIIRTSHFNPGNVTTRDKSVVLYNGAALSPDQNTLYFVGVHGIWAANTHDLNVKGNYATQQEFTGIALGNNGQTIYAVYPTNGITMVNTASGQSQRVTQSPAHTPWGIAWVAPS